MLSDYTVFCRASSTPLSLLFFLLYVQGFVYLVYSGVFIVRPALVHVASGPRSSVWRQPGRTSALVVMRANPRGAHGPIGMQRAMSSYLYVNIGRAFKKRDRNKGVWAGLHHGVWAELHHGVWAGLNQAMFASCVGGVA